MKKRMLTGLTPSGKLTIGNYFGAIKQIIENQKEYDLYAFIANMHAITNPIESKSLQDNINEMVKLYYACGLDFNNSNIYLQSDIKSLFTLSWILTCSTTMGELSRMTQFKDKSNKVKLANNTTFIPTGLLTYPALMAADILLFSPEIIPVGADQKQHIELARDIAIRFNNKYGKTFIVPEFSTPKVGTKIMDLSEPTKKMSKSSDNKKAIIMLLDDLNDVKKKIASAVTDSENIVKYDIENKPGVSNLITIYAACKNIEIVQAESLLKDKNYKEFKDSVFEALCPILEDIQNKYKNSNIENIKTNLANNSAKLNNEADIKVNEVLNKIGANI